MAEWERVPLGEVLTLQRGIDLPDRDRSPGSVPIMGSFGVTGWHTSAACSGPGVTVGRSGASIGTVCYIDREYWPLNTCLYVKDFKGNNPRYIFYLLKTLELSQYNSGSAQPSLNRNFVHPIPVVVPPRCGQDHIASTLGTLDDKIDLNRRMNETLEAMARAIFKDWFVDFGPTRAKMEGRAPYLAPEIWALFPNRLDDEEKPEGWEYVALTEFSEEVRRGISPSYISDGGIRVLNQKCIRDRQVNFEPARRHDHGRRKVDDRLLRPGDILVNSTGVGTLGRVAQIWDLHEPTIVDSHVTIVRPNEGPENAYYVGVNLLNREQEIEALGEGSTGQTELSRTRLSTLSILRAGEDEQRAFAELIEPLVKKSLQNGRESETLTATRDLLLPKLMSGEIRVKDAEKLAEAAA